MKKITLLIFAFLLMQVCANAQQGEMYAREGFDVLQANIPHGKIDTISYNSKTVGNARRALIYTPPGFTKRQK